MTSERPEICPECGSSRILEFLYGEVGPEIAQVPGYDKIALGGCVIEQDSPAWKCGNCGATWGVYYGLFEK